jgi:choline dehydrogenase
VLGGGSSINVMIWSRGHRGDWDLFAAESGEPAWGYEPVLDLYRQIEDWHGVGEPNYRGTGGLLFVQPAPAQHPVTHATLAAACEFGIPTYQSPNGRLMQEVRGAAVIELSSRGGKRQSIFRTYIAPYWDQPNLTVVPNALVTNVTFQGNRATGVEVLHDGVVNRVTAAAEVVLSLGAIQTPKVLMQSGIGDEDELTGPFPKATPECVAKYGLPPNSWLLFGAPTHPKSRGRVRLSGPAPSDPPRIEANALSHPDDLKATISCLETLREIGNSAQLRPFVAREVMPGDATRDELETYLRDAICTYWHESGTAKMGRDPMSVVDGHLNVYGIENLRIADASIMPCITNANTMAPCVVIGERAAQFIKSSHRL